MIKNLIEKEKKKWSLLLNHSKSITDSFGYLATYHAIHKQMSNSLMSHPSIIPTNVGGENYPSDQGSEKKKKCKPSLVSFTSVNMNIFK